jgi:DNA-binding NtrC family response regulator
VERHSVLLVDDEENVLKSLARALKGEPYEVVSARGAEEALRLLERRPVSLVISDLNMPGTGGFELLRTIKERHPEVIRLILTGQADTKAAMRAINEGEVYRFFTKPWNNDELRLSIRQTLQHFELVREANRLLGRLEKQQDLLRNLETKYPGITQGASEEVFVIDEELLSVSAEEYLKEFSPASGSESEDG